MTPNVQLCTAEDSNRDAAGAMAALDVGLLPAAENDRLVGMISDRDIATHRVVMGCGPDMPVRDVMTADVKYCFEDQEIDEVPRNMADIQVRRCSIETSTWSESLRSAISQFASRETAPQLRCTGSRSAVDNMRAPLVYGRALDGSGAWNSDMADFLPRIMGTCHGSWKPSAPK